MAIVRAGPNSGTTVLLPSLARTATNTTQVVSPLWARGAIICFDSTAETSSAIVTVTMEILDGAGLYTEVYWTADATVTTITDTSWVFYPTGLVTGSKELDSTETINAAIPREWQLTLTHTDADSFTYSVFVQWLP